MSDHDEIAWLMETLDVSFVEAVEIIAVQREGLEWLERNRPAQPPEDAE